MIYSLRVFGCCITNTRPRVPGWEGWADMCASCVHYSCIPEFKGKRQRGTVSVLSTLCRYKTAIMSILLTIAVQIHAPRPHGLKCTLRMQCFTEDDVNILFRENEANIFNSMFKTRTKITTACPLSHTRRIRVG